MRRLAMWALLIGLIATVGCDESNDEITLVTPPLGIRSTFPVDADSSNAPIDFHGVVSLTVVFDRETTSTLIGQRIYPQPATDGTLGTVDRRSWTLHDLELTPATGTYYWMIDGVNMNEPFVLRVRTEFRHPFGGFDGTITSPNPARVDASGTVVFALPVDTDFNVLEPWTFVDTSPVGLAVALNNDFDEDDDAEYEMRFLEFAEPFIIVAVLDTNNDLLYDPATDWWGYYAVDGSIAPVAAGRWQSVDLVPEFNGLVNITLREPVPMPELPAQTDVQN